MSEASAIDAAARRLALALDSLQAAVVRRREADRGGDAVSVQMHAIGVDRARLAAELDATAAQVRDMEDINREVARRIDIVIGTIQHLLEQHDR